MSNVNHSRIISFIVTVKNLKIMQSFSSNCYNSVNFERIKLIEPPKCIQKINYKMISG